MKILPASFCEPSRRHVLLGATPVVMGATTASFAASDEARSAEPPDRKASQGARAMGLQWA